MRNGRQIERKDWNSCLIHAYRSDSLVGPCAKTLVPVFPRRKFVHERCQSHPSALLVRSGNKNLDGLALLDFLEGFLGLLEAHDTCDELLYIDLAARDKLNSQRIVAWPVPE